MQVVQPQVLVDSIRAAGVLCVPSRRSAATPLAKHPTHALEHSDLLLIRRAVARRVLEPARLRIGLGVLDDGSEQRIRIVDEDVRLVAVPLAEGCRHVLQLVVPYANHLPLILDRIVAVRQRQRRKVDRGHAQEQEVAGACRVDLLEQAIVHGEDLVVQGRGVAEPPRVADVVDADPEGKERVGVFPGDSGRGLAVDGEILVLDLVLEGENGGLVGSDESAVDGRSAVCEVVGLKLAGVVGCGQEADPVGTAGEG